MKGFEDLPSDWSPAEIWCDVNGQRYQMVRFIVAGQPIQQGNIIAGRYGNLYDKTKGLRPWRDMVSWAAKAAMAGGYRRRTGDMKIVGPPHRDDKMIGDTFSLVTRLDLFDGPVAVDVTFIRRRPKTVPEHARKKGITQRQWDAGATVALISFPDLDKLVRAAEDSMTGIVYHDDAQVVECHSRKRYADVGETPGIIVTVTSNVDVK